MPATSTIEPANVSVQLSTAKYRVVSTGSLIVLADDSVNFTIEGLLFKFDFVKDPGKEQGVSGSVVKDDNGEPQYYNFKFYNTEAADFASVAEPVHLATLGGKGLYFIFSIQTLSAENYSHRLMFYTWYLEK